MKDKPKVLFLGTADFPFGMAEVEKQTLIARSLSEAGCHVKFICKKSFNYNCSLPFKGRFLGIDYIYTSLSSRRLKNKYLNHLSWNLGNLIEKLIILFSKYDFVIASSRDYDEIRLYSKIIHYRNKKLYLTHVEDARSMYKGNDPGKLWKIEKFETRTWSIIDGVFPISEELSEQIRKVSPSLPQLKIPVLVDLNDVDKADIYANIDKEYFMFCGSADYYKTIDLIISGFEIANLNMSLLLVLNGSRSGMDLIDNRIKKSTCISKIIVKSKLSKTYLWGYYQKAFALLIPLNFDQRDKARFPHKLGEYCAVGKPIITSKWGEIPFYFTDAKNAILLESDDSIELSKAFITISNDHSLRDKLGRGALDLAINEFDYRLYGNKIVRFLELNDGN